MLHEKRAQFAKGTKRSREPDDAPAGVAAKPQSLTQLPAAADPVDGYQAVAAAYFGIV